MAINETLIEEEEEEEDDEEEAAKNARQTRYENLVEEHVGRDFGSTNANHDYVDSAKHLYENHEISPQQQLMGNEEKLDLLRNLLASERRNNLQRHRNNQAMQQYIRHLQNDYLRSQQDVIEALELGRCVKAQKEAQLAALSSTVEEKDRLIEQLRLTIDNLDERKLREQFKGLLDKQKELAEAEKEQLRKQLEAIQQQLVGERVNNSQILQQFQAKLEEQLVTHDKETKTLRDQVANLEVKLERVLEEPKEIIIKELKEDKSRLALQLEDANLRSEESLKRFQSLKERLQGLVADQEQVEQKHNDELERFQAEQDQQRALLTQLKLKLEDKEELLQILQFNLDRCERRSKNLLNALKGKESAYKEMIGLMQVKHEEELERSTIELRACREKLVDLENELDNKRNQLIKLELEQENQLESIRNDRDQRIQKMVQERQKADRELQMAEIKLAHEKEELEIKNKQVNQLKKEVNQFKEESKRLSIELTKSEAKLCSKQKELNEAMKTSKQSMLIPARPLSAKTNRTLTTTATVRCQNQHNLNNYHHLKRNKITKIYDCEEVI